MCRIENADYYLGIGQRRRDVMKEKKKKTITSLN